MSVVEKDYTKLYGKHVETKAIPHRELKYTDWPDVKEKTVLAVPDLGVFEEEGLIIKLHGKVRMDLKTGGYAEVYFDEYGRELTADDVRRMPPRMQRSMSPHKVWDFEIAEILITDGPRQREILMQTHEQRKAQDAQKETRRQDTETLLAESLSKLAERLPEPEARRGPGRPRKDEP